MKLQAHHFLLPAIWLNTLFGNQRWSELLVFFGQFFYWASLVLASLVICQAFRHALWTYLLVGLVVASRIASLAEIPGTEVAYLGSMLLLFVLAGVAMALHHAPVIAAQARGFLIACLPVMFLQVAGFGAWFQTFNTLYIVAPGTEPGEIIARPEIHLMPLFLSSQSDLLATHLSDFYEFLSMQSRPPGLSHSSAMLGFFILAGAALHLGRMRSGRSAAFDAILVGVVVMSGAKLALLGFLVLAFVAAVRARGAIRRRVLKLFPMMAAAFLVYAILFPASLAQNFSRDAFEVSFLTRAVDAAVALAPDLVYLPEIAEVVSTYSATFEEDRGELGGLSGTLALLKIAPFVLLAGLLALTWLLRGLRRCRKSFPEGERTAALMWIPLVMAPLATPLFGSQSYAICIGVAVMPIVFGLSPGLRTRMLPRVSMQC